MKFEFKSHKPSGYWAGTIVRDWLDWKWQMRQSLKTLTDFERQFVLSEEEIKGFTAPGFQIRVTPYYSSLASQNIEHDPLRKIFMPRGQELEVGLQAQKDPLGELKNGPVPRILHRYSDRVLFLVTDVCSVYCRYCTRKHFTGKEESLAKKDDYETALTYIRANAGIREVILSGGDPLTLGDEALLKIVEDIRKIEHVELIRIGSRMPVVNPMRLNADLAKELKKFKPVFLMTHFNHPRELTAEAAQGLESFVDHGVPVFNQMVLLNGVNNSAAIVQALSRRLVFLRVKPYYMFQCDPSMGTDHLRTSIDNSLEIQRELWGHLSGIAMPTFAVDIPDGGGKTYMVPDFQVSQSKSSREFKGWDGVISQYINPPDDKIVKPLDDEVYLEEWQQIRSSRNYRF